MGWFERLSGSDTQEGARPASVAEHVEIRRWRADHKPLKSDESLGWKGHLFTGYHLHKVEKNESTEYIKTRLPGTTSKINTDE
ncbi:MAG: hypothetical protein ACRDR6_29355 [Pseudonocardiaceae bacterium]